MAGLQTQFDFTLPKGFVDDDGVLHRHGTMRLATARDEIEPLRSRDIDGPDDPYLTVLVLARVITDLGTIDQIETRHVEQLFAADLAFLQDLYGIINFGDPADVAALQASVLPEPAADQPPEPAAAPAPAETVEASQPTGDDTSAGAGGSSSVRSRARIEEVPSSSTS
ncbi:MAG: hypothetical protein RIB65_07915 [Ilumatobacter fluminis]|uniref:hypothetical protein n=1 Tax=Ilumatobacter fluminis TaxID=467091 RepID=UPI0032EF84FA